MYTSLRLHSHIRHMETHWEAMWDWAQRTLTSNTQIAFYHGYRFSRFRVKVSLDCHVLSVLRFSLMFICTLSSSMVGFLISLLAKVYFVNRIDRERNRFKHKHITHLPIARVPHVYWVPFHLDFLIDLSKLHSIGNNLI
jgi:hypothetical protein